MLKQFLEKALPTKGVYCTTGIKDGYARNYFHESIEDTLNKINQLDADGYNVFVAMSSFDGYSRKSEHSLYTRSFFIDLDVDTSGVNPKKYIDKSSALKALEEFIAHAELPPPVIVDSGTGVHAYWFLDQDVPSAEWAKYARKFKEICQEHLLIDPVVTADRARIMRAPGTRNFKHEPPVQSTILHWAEDSYDFSAFRNSLVHLLITQEIQSDPFWRVYLEDLTRQRRLLRLIQTTNPFSRSSQKKAYEEMAATRSSMP